MHALSLNIADGIDERQKIPVRRKHIWTDTKRALVPSGFSDAKGLSVTFICEPAVDDGGPLREFFRLLMLGINNDASLFCGSENEKSLTQCLALQRKEYYYVGKCIARSLSYGGSGPHFFCETIARHLCKEPITSPTSDVLNYETREKLEKVIFLRTQLYNNYSCTFISIVVHSFNVDM